MVELEDLLGCTIKCGLTKMTFQIYQPHLITQMTKKFNEDMKSLMILNALNTLHKWILIHQETYTKMPHNLRKRYRSAVGSLLYLVKHS